MDTPISALRNPPRFSTLALPLKDVGNSEGVAALPITISVVGYNLALIVDGSRVRERNPQRRIN
jgi:hypothetical protein